jgi:hypothetical protein
VSAITTTPRASKAISGHPVLISAARHIQPGGLMMVTLGCRKQVLRQPRWALVVRIRTHGIKGTRAGCAYRHQTLQVNVMGRSYAQSTCCFR